MGATLLALVLISPPVPAPEHPVAGDHGHAHGAEEEEADLPPDPDAAIKGLAREAMEAFVKFYPAVASYNGVGQHHGRLGDYSRVSITAYLVAVKEQLARLEKLSMGEFTDAGRVERDALAVHLRSQIWQLEGLSAPTRDPNFYVDESVVALHVLVDRSIAAPAMQAGYLIQRMEQFERFFATAKENLGPCPRPAVQRAITRLRAARPLFERELQIISIQPGKPEETARGRAATTGGWKQVSAFADWLEKERLPGAVMPPPLGEKLWHQWLLAREDVDLPQESVLAAAAADMARLEQELVEAAAAIDRKAAPRDLLATIAGERLEPRLAIGEAERILGKLWNMFPERPVALPSDEPLGVRETPAVRRREAPVRVDLPGAFDLTGDVTFLEISPPDPEWPQPILIDWLEQYGRTFLPLAITREVYPGKYAAWQYTKRSGVATCKTARFPTMTEGWGLVAEEITVRLGFGGHDPKLRVAMLADLIRADARLIASIRLHLLGAPPAEIASWLERKGMWSSTVATAEMSRLLSQPDAAAPALGRLAILSLREDVKKQEGKAFLEKDFYSDLLGFGAAPVSAIRRILLERPGTLLAAPKK